MVWVPQLPLKLVSDQVDVGVGGARGHRSDYRIMMAQQHCDAGTAFAILQRASQNRNIKVRELAAEIVTAVGGTPSEPGAFQPRRS